MSAKSVYTTIFVLAGALAVSLGITASNELHHALEVMNLNNCTFVCNSNTVLGFWSLVAFATMSTLGAISFAILAHFTESKVS